MKVWHVVALSTAVVLFVQAVQRLVPEVDPIRRIPARAPLF